MQRDAIVINAHTGNVLVEVDVLPLEDIGGGKIDCGDPNAIDLMWSAELASQGSDTEYTVVWFDDRTSPVFECPTHDMDELTSLRDATIIEGQEDEEQDSLICLNCM